MVNIDLKTQNYIKLILSQSEKALYIFLDRIPKARKRQFTEEFAVVSGSKALQYQDLYYQLGMRLSGRQHV